MPAHRMRCSQSKQKGCGRRFRLDKAPHIYNHVVRCPYCGSDQVNSVEAARQAETERLKEKSHMCSGYSFIHVRGSLRGCDEHPLNGKPMTDAEHREYERLTAKKYQHTPRVDHADQPQK